jgi:hypothetical protein
MEQDSGGKTTGVIVSLISLSLKEATAGRLKQLISSRVD